MRSATALPASARVLVGSVAQLPPWLKDAARAHGGAKTQRRACVVGTPHTARISPRRGRGTIQGARDPKLEVRPARGFAWS